MLERRAPALFPLPSEVAAEKRLSSSDMSISGALSSINCDRKPIINKLYYFSNNMKCEK